MILPLIDGFVEGVRADAGLRPAQRAQREVLELVAAGVRNADIAVRLYLSPKTVRNHISNISAKLQVADRAEAIATARAAGLGSSS